MLLPVAHREMHRKKYFKLISGYKRSGLSMNMEDFLDKDFAGCCAQQPVCRGWVPHAVCTTSGKQGLDSAPEEIADFESLHHKKENGLFSEQSITAQQVPE